MTTIRTVIIAGLSLIITLSVAQAASLDDEGRPITSLHQMGEYPQGWVNWVEDDLVVIDDTEYRLTERTRILTVENSSAGPGFLVEDMKVVFEPGDDFELVTIQEMKLDEEDRVYLESRSSGAGDQDDAVTDTTLQAPAGEIYQEGGVWKN